MSFRCDASGCGHSAKSMSALNRHRNKCKCFVTQFQDLSQRNASRKRNAQGISSEPESNYRRQKRRSDIKGNMVIDDTQFLGDTTTPPNVEDVYEPLVQDEWNGEEINVLLASEDFSANSPPKRPTHQRQIYVDVPPEGPGELLPPHIAPHQRTFTFRIPPAICETIPNSFGVYRKYSGRIDAIPDRIHGFTHLTSRSTQLGQESSNLTEPTRPIRKQYGPCRNQSVFALKYWHWVLGGAKTGVSQTQLIDLLQWDGFDQHQVKRSDATPVDEALGQPLELDTTIKRGDGWRRCNVGIAIPLPGQQNFDPHTSTTTTNSGNNIFQVPGLFLRSLSTIIKETLEQPTAKSFHWKPFQQFWRPNPAFPSQRIYDELYSSPIWLDADEWVQNLNIPGCNLPRAIAGLMFWSDATCVSEFGTRSLWPIYMFFGNQSKYDRSRPSSHAGHQVAFLPSIEDNIQDFVRDACGMSASKDLLTFCKRELMHEAWRLLLDGDFMDGWKHGWVIKCGDGIMRRIFPRIFTYSADYPEKALLATIRDKGGCPCPRCLVKMENTDKAGTPNDMIERSRRIRKDSLAVQALVLKARRSIFQDGKGVKSAAVEKVLKSHSLVPTVNAFSSLFTSADMNYYDIFVIDFLHEFELGIWKAVLTHLIRILHAFGEEKVHILDQRMRNTPIFGADTIRRFTNNVSELKKMAARDFEDILQTIIPAIEDLIDQPHDTTILHLLYQLAEYQALAKMRMHTDASLAHWDIVTKTVTNSLRAFQQSSQAIRTFETPRERNNRLRRSQAGPHAPATVNGPTLRTLNLRTYKFHAMGDGPATVRRYGTTDSYTTQIGERQHRVPKSMYRRSSKNRHATQQITVQEQRERNLRYLAAHNPGSLPPSFTPQPKSGSKAIGAITEAELGLHHFIAADEKRFIHLPTWLNDASRKTDPAFLNFRTNLRNHLLSRIKKEQVDEDFPSFSEEEQRKISLKSDRIYEHPRLRVFYTTYDLRRAADSIDLVERRDVMTPAYYNDDTTTRHPFWYARVLGIYHAHVSFAPTQKFERIEFLWVRWFAWDSSFCGGWETRALDRVAYDDPNYQFGFLDPAAVIRAAHLIPAWAHGKTQEYFPDSGMKDPAGDFVYHYVNRFADRDMYLRYHGGGIGHCQSTGAAPSNTLPTPLQDEPALSSGAEEDRSDVGEPEYMVDRFEGLGTGRVPEVDEVVSASSSEDSEGDGSVYLDDDEGMDDFDAE